MTEPRLDVDRNDARGGASQLLVAVIAAAVVLLFGLLLVAATAPSRDRLPDPRLPVTNSTPVSTPSSEVG